MRAATEDPPRVALVTPTKRPLRDVQSRCRGQWGGRSCRGGRHRSKHGNSSSRRRSSGHGQCVESCCQTVECRRHRQGVGRDRSAREITEVNGCSWRPCVLEGVNAFATCNFLIVNIHHRLVALLRGRQPGALVCPRAPVPWPPGHRRVLLARSLGACSWRVPLPRALGFAVATSSCPLFSSCRHLSRFLGREGPMT